jgi:hypothetical protein
MAQQRVTDRLELNEAPANDDVLHIVDVSENSSKKIRAERLREGLATEQALQSLDDSLANVAKSGDYDDLDNKPNIPDVSNFETTTQLNARDTANRARANHTGTQAISTVDGLQGALDGKAPTSHTHTASQITDFDTAVANNSAVQANTAKISFDSASSSKLAGIEAGAQVNTVTSVASKTGAVTLVKGDVGLGNVDNTSDLNKPISTATQTALNGKANTSHTHTASDVTDFQTAVSANSDVVANTAKISFDSTSSSKLAGIEAGAQVNTVTSVATKTGAVTLDTNDVTEATNLYYTEARVSANTDVAANTAARHDAVTLAGTPNYLTIAGQVITRALINLTSHVTGILPIANGGTGSDTQNFVDLTTAQTVAGVKTFSDRMVTGETRAATSGGYKVTTNSGTDAVLIGGGGSANFTSYGNTLLNAETASRPVILDGSKVLRGADPATYPSLTELAYVKGLTSAVQTQLDSKVDFIVTSEASSATPTATGTALKNDYVATALTVNATLAAPSGTANANGMIRYRITASGGTRTIGYNAALEEGNITRTTSLAAGETLTQIYQRVDGEWRCEFESVTS